MKFVLAAVLMITSSVAFANTPEQNEAISLANALVNSPEATKQMNEKDVVVMSYSIARPQQGVNVYTMTLDRNCFCPRQPGHLTITEDYRPAMADGPIKYSYELVWEKKN